MFTGIIENLGTVSHIEKEGENLHITIKSHLTPTLKIDQSVAHNGVCLTVVAINDDTFKVTAIKETLDKTTIGSWKIGDVVNIERAMVAGARLDGHMVQGHVDTTAFVKKIEDANGSWNFTFKFRKKPPFVLVDKGSVCIDGVSLTVVKAGRKKFSVSIIPYTFEHTRFHLYQEGDAVNIEFDIIGKYIQQYIQKVGKHAK
jgi:riboflavin synthase